jgi:predicted Na+-dependent transporter
MIEVMAEVAIVVFVVGSMVALGLSLTFTQIRLALANRRLVIVALVLNFLLSPFLALLIAWIFGLADYIAAGLVLTACAAGAPFLPKLVNLARGDTATGVGLMVLLMAVTVLFMPLALPALLRGVYVNPLDVANSLVFLMLLPLCLALLAHARYGEATAPLKKLCAQASNFSLLLLAGTLIVVNFESMLNLVGTRGLIAAVVFSAALAAVGYVLGGTAMSLATAQRNTAAALVVAGQNFSGDVITYVTVASLIGLLVIFPLAAELGKRAKRKMEEDDPEAVVDEPSDAQAEG